MRRTLSTLFTTWPSAIRHLRTHHMAQGRTISGLLMRGHAALNSASAGELRPISSLCWTVGSNSYTTTIQLR